MFTNTIKAPQMFYSAASAPSHAAAHASPMANYTTYERERRCSLTSTHTHTPRSDRQEAGAKAAVSRALDPLSVAPWAALLSCEIPSESDVLSTRRVSSPLAYADAKEPSVSSTSPGYMLQWKYGWRHREMCPCVHRVFDQLTFKLCKKKKETGDRVE